MAVAVADRVWNGAHGGAVITWLTDLASEGPPRDHGEPRFPNNDSPATRGGRPDEIRCSRSGLTGPRASQATRGPVGSASELMPKACWFTPRDRQLA